jgi:hypothetical protein
MARTEKRREPSGRPSECAPLLDEHETANRLGLSVKTLRRWRWLKRGLPWVRVGAAVRYVPEDVVAFIEANREVPEQRGGEIP